MKKLSILLLTSALITSPTLAKAQWYAAAGGGFQVPRDKNIKTTIGQETDLNTGWGALAAAGYKFDNGLRTELEFGYRDADIDNIASSTLTGGSEHVSSLMGNVLYDIDTGTILTPYVGAGMGVGRVSYDNVHTINGSTLDDSDVGLAVQGIAGVSLVLSDSLSFFTQYQYQNILNLQTSTNSGLAAKSDYSNSLITAGLRWEFSMPTKTEEHEKIIAAPLPEQLPAPPAAPVVEEKKEEMKKEVISAPVVEKYMVFFDFDRSDITIEAADILKKVVDNAKKGKVTSLEVTGHADRAGSDKYNMRLAQRRADAVKKQLIRLGLPGAEITTAAKGERDPLVPTKDGVREPQNRRVEILYGK